MRLPFWYSRKPKGNVMQCETRSANERGLQMLVSDTASYRAVKEHADLGKNRDAQSSASSAAASVNSFTLNTPGSARRLHALKQGALQSLDILRDLSVRDSFDRKEINTVFGNQSGLRRLKVVSGPASTADLVLEALGKSVNKRDAGQASARLAGKLQGLQTLIFENPIRPAQQDQAVPLRSRSSMALPFPLSNLKGRTLTELVIAGYPSSSTKQHNQTFGELLRHLPELRALDLRFSTPHENARQQMWEAIDSSPESSELQPKNFHSKQTKTSELPVQSANAIAKPTCQNLEYLNLSGWHLSAEDCLKLVELLEKEKLPRLTHLVLAQAKLPARSLQNLVQAFAALQKRNSLDVAVNTAAINITTNEIDDEDWLEVSSAELTTSLSVSPNHASSNLVTDPASETEITDSPMQATKIHSTAGGLLDLAGCVLLDEKNQALDEASAHNVLSNAEAEAPQFVRLQGPELSIEDSYLSREDALNAQHTRLRGSPYAHVEDYFSASKVVA